ncbi:RecX family transcriptional regulator [Candidatus Saccharibacteria bacterium]|nr:RecX family transcriptional regulator [Candidatus Saccharibacteria bacterium]
MEIYKLKDEVPEGRRGRTGAEGRRKGALDMGESGGILRVTEMKSGVRNPERVNVYVNGKYALSLDVVQVVDYHLKVGMVLSAEKLGELRKASEFGVAYQRALEWVLMRPRSEREARDYLRKKIYEKKLDGGYVDEIMVRLKSKKYLDDYRFAEFWVENRFVKKGVSRKRLEIELKNKGVKQEIIEEVLSGRSDEEEVRKMIGRKRKKYDNEKLIAYLCRQGFSYDLVRRLVEESD